MNPLLLLQTSAPVDDDGQWCGCHAGGRGQNEAFSVCGDVILECDVAGTLTDTSLKQRHGSTRFNQGFWPRVIRWLGLFHGDGCQRSLLAHEEQFLAVAAPARLLAAPA